MAETVFYGKKRLCYTDNADFTDFQGIGSDPMYNRYDSVNSVLQNNIDEQYQSFLARPFYDESEGRVYWYADDWNDEPKSLNELSGSERIKYDRIKETTVEHYKERLSKMSKGSDAYRILSDATKYISDEFIYCYDNKVSLIAWGMCLDSAKTPIGGRWVKEVWKDEDKFKVTFEIGNEGEWEMGFPGSFNRKKGTKLTRVDVPRVVAKEGYEFAGWTPEPIGYEVTEDVIFVAQYNKVSPPPPESPVDGGLGISDEHEPWQEPSMVSVKFEAGQFGTIKGTKELSVPRGHVLSGSQIPSVSPSAGYVFKGWDHDISRPIDLDTVFEAQYETAALPWYKRFWAWLTGKGCLKWLLWILLFIVLLVILILLLRGCDHNGGDPTPTEGNIDKVYPIDQVTDPETGEPRDDNGEIGSIVDDDGNLPDDDSPIVAPIHGGTDPVPIVTDPSIPGSPTIIANRLNIFFDDADADLNEWVQKFKRLYPGDNYQIIGMDKYVPMLQIMIPETERDKIRETLPRQIPTIAFFVVDESLFERQERNFEKADASSGWHLNAVHADEAWKYTEGSDKIVVAIVDDGIDAEHPIFKDKSGKSRFYNAYNVFTQNRSLSIGDGHGTHVAGLAVGNKKYRSKGVSGIAPNCKIMPVQVYDNEYCTFSSLVSGIMYAIHHDANVVNVSSGPNLSELKNYPLEEQRKIARLLFKDEQKVWEHIFDVAKSDNVIIVFAAGNDSILTYILPECRSENTINVSAVTSEFRSTSFTNYEVGSTISAPGDNIYSSFPKSNFEWMSGTSMAAPIVSGAVALMLSINSKVSISEIIKIFNETGQRTDGRVPPMVLIDKALERLMEKDGGNGSGGGGNGGDGSGNGNGGGNIGGDDGTGGGSNGGDGSGNSNGGGNGSGDDGTGGGSNGGDGSGDGLEPTPPGPNPEDSYLDDLLALLKQLQAQRDALDNQINELIKKIEDARSKR